MSVFDNLVSVAPGSAAIKSGIDYLAGSDEEKKAKEAAARKTAEKYKAQGQEQRDRTNEIVAGGNRETASAISASDQRLGQTLSSLGIDAKAFGDNRITGDTPLGETLQMLNLPDDGTMIPEKPTAYSARIAGLDRQVRDVNTNAEKADKALLELEQKYNVKRNEAENERLTARIEADEQIVGLHGKKLEAAKLEEERLVGDPEAYLKTGKPSEDSVFGQVQKDMALYSDGIRKAFENVKTPKEPGTFGDLIGFFDDNDNFSAKKTASTFFWLAGVFGNTFLSIGTEGKIPNYFMNAFFKAVDSDFKAKRLHAQKQGEKAALGAEGINATLKRFDNDVDQLNVYRGAMLRRLNSAIDQIQMAPELRALKDNPAFQKAILEWKKEVGYEQKLTDSKVANAIKNHRMSMSAESRQILSAASAAELREFQMEQHRAELIRAKLAPEEEKIVELTNKDMEFYQQNGTTMELLQEGMAIIELFEDEGKGDFDKGLNAFLADSPIAKYFEASPEDRLTRIGQQLGRLFARQLDKGVLTDGEQQFAQDTAGFLARSSMSQIKGILESYENRVASSFMNRYMLTHESKRPIIAQTMSYYGLSDPDAVAEAMVKNKVLPVTARGYDNKRLRESFKAEILGGSYSP
jgi:flagellin-like hook-associated protein FlgL